MQSRRKLLLACSFLPRRATAAHCKTRFQTNSTNAGHYLQVCASRYDAKRHRCGRRSHDGGTRTRRADGPGRPGSVLEHHRAITRAQSAHLKLSNLHPWANHCESTVFLYKWSTKRYDRQHIHSLFCRDSRGKRIRSRGRWLHVAGQTTHSTVSQSL